MLWGERLDRPTYSFLHTLDEGNTAVCRRGFHEIFQQDVVQKTVSMLGFESAVTNEPALLKRVEHDHIVKVWEAQWDPKLTELRAITFVSPYYKGGSIYTALSGGYEFGVHQVMQIADHTLNALDAMHKTHGIVHRDVKPANIMLSENRTVGYLGDLGSAAHIDPSTGCVSSEMGSPLYQAPEARPGGFVTPRADLYALGVTVVEMLNGPFPYDRLDACQIDQRLTLGRRALPDSYYTPSPWVPKQLASWVKSLCHCNPDKRPADAATALRALRNLRVVDWRRLEGEKLEGRWHGYWPPQSLRPDQRIYEIRTEAITKGIHKGKLAASARWRLSNGKWRNYAKLKTQIEASNASLGRFFRSVESNAQAAPTR